VGFVVSPLPVRALAENGRVLVRLSRPPDADPTQVTLEVQDNGIGLSDEERGKVFERFYQADQSMTRRGGGCGLGLSIVQYIVRAHQGSVEVESAPGKGSLFRVRMPLRVSDLPAA
jgi:signal transduction histidine kinase